MGGIEEIPCSLQEVVISISFYLVKSTDTFERYVGEVGYHFHFSTLAGVPLVS